jgi:serine/threonine-protein kinase
MSEPDPFVGRTIAGKYRIVQLLGEGGMGCVYVGEQLLGTTTRKVAVKTLHKHLSHDPQVKARFQREVGTIATLQHPNTIQVFDFGETDDGTLYIVMELVQGKSLADTLEKEGAMLPARAEKILTQVCGSLEEAHSLGIVHRDLKPDNIVLCERAGQKDWVEVLDFGIAKRSNENDEREAKLTQQGMVLGTPPYMSPEQFTGQPIDARSDIYALGVMAYEMLTAKLPFAANTPWEWATQHMTAQPTPFEAQPNGASLPPRARSAVMRALAKKPDERPRTVTEFLEEFCGGEAPALSFQPAGGTAVGAAGGRAKTEMATPAFGAAPPMGPGAMGGAPPGVGAAPGMGGPPAMGAGSGYGASPPGMGAAPPVGAVPAHIPRAPSPQDSQGSGGNRGLLLGVAGVVALLTIVGVVVLTMKGKHNDDVAPLDLTSSSAASNTATTDTAPTTTATPPDTAAQASGGMPALVTGTSSGSPHTTSGGTSGGASGTHPTSSGGTSGGTSGGASSSSGHPATVVTLAGKPTQTAPPPPPPPPPQKTPECIAWEQAVQQNSPRAPAMRAACERSKAGH